MGLRSVFVPALVASLTVAGGAAAADIAAAFKGPGGDDVGSARLAEGPTGVLVRLDLKGLKPGWHAIHFHAKGDCSDRAFESAGAHINHAGMAHPHGLLNPQGPDLGDLPNIYAGPDGTSKAEVFSALVSFTGSGGRAALQDGDGSALVIHAQPDDYTSQPIGGAGPRVACAVVK